MLLVKQISIKINAQNFKTLLLRCENIGMFHIFGRRYVVIQFCKYWNHLFNKVVCSMANGGFENRGW